MKGKGETTRLRDKDILSQACRSVEGLRDDSAEVYRVLGKDIVITGQEGLHTSERPCVLRCLDKGNDNRNAQGPLFKRSGTGRTDKVTS